MARKGIDSITLEVLWNRFLPIAEEAATEIVRTAFSTTIRESRNFAVIILNPNGQSIAQARSTMPSFVGALPITAKKLLQIFPQETLKPDDLILTNDPWMGTGHLQDLTSLTPVFYKSKLVAIIGITTQVTDMGGKLRSPEVREIYEEGLQLPPCKYMSAGQINEDILRIIRKNVRVPNQVEGDMISHMSAGRLAAQRIGEMLEEYKLADIEAPATTIFQRSENAMREAIRKWKTGNTAFRYPPTGTMSRSSSAWRSRYAAAAFWWITRAHPTGRPRPERRSELCLFLFRLFAQMPVLSADSQQRGQLPARDGIGPEGSILNPRYPAPVNGRSMVGHFIPSAIFGALCKAVPNLVQAASGSPTWAINAAGITKETGTSPATSSCTEDKARRTGTMGAYVSISLRTRRIHPSKSSSILYPCWWREKRPSETAAARANTPAATASRSS